jgi:hypothetical protein
MVSVYPQVSHGVVPSHDAEHGQDDDDQDHDHDDGQGGAQHGYAPSLAISAAKVFVHVMPYLLVAS